MPVQLQKHVLRQFFGRGAILKEVKRDAEHHRLVAADDVLEIERLRVVRVSRARELGPHLGVHILLGTYTRGRGPEDAWPPRRGRQLGYDLAMRSWSASQARMVASDWLTLSWSVCTAISGDSGRS